MGAPYSSANINSNTVAIGHDHDASSFPQPSPYDIYSLGELAVSTNGQITMDYTVFASADYVLVVTDRNQFNTFLTNNPESNLEKDSGGNYTGDLDPNSNIGKDVQAIGQAAYNADPRAGTSNDKLAEIDANEASLVYLLSTYGTGITLLKKDSSGQYKAMHFSSSTVNGVNTYSSSPCN